VIGGLSSPYCSIEVKSPTRIGSETGKDCRKPGPHPCYASWLSTQGKNEALPLLSGVRE